MTSLLSCVLWSVETVSVYHSFSQHHTSPALIISSSRAGYHSLIPACAGVSVLVAGRRNVGRSEERMLLLSAQVAVCPKISDTHSQLQPAHGQSLEQIQQIQAHLCCVSLIMITTLSTFWWHSLDTAVLHDPLQSWFTVVTIVCLWLSLIMSTVMFYNNNHVNSQYVQPNIDTHSSLSSFEYPPPPLTPGRGQSY